MADKRGSICLVTYREVAGVEKAVGEIKEKEKALLGKLSSKRPVDNILVLFKSLQGAVYNANASGFDYWSRRQSRWGAGRVSVVYHPMFMQYEGILQYLTDAAAGGFQPVVLADISTVMRMRIETGMGQVSMDLPGIRQVLREIAEDKEMEFVEIPLNSVGKSEDRT